MAESSGAKSTKESHSSVSSSGEASGGQKASPQSSLVLTAQYTEDASSTPTKVTIASPTSSLPTNVPPLATQNAPSSSDTPSPVARRAHNTDSAANLADSEGESKQEAAVKQSKLTKSFLSRFRQKNAEMHKIFRDLPKTEKLIDDYSCALHREILAQGRMYVTQSYLCFYANIFTWETLLVIPLNRVKSVTKEKRALLFPTAIHITTATDKYGFSSFIQRDVSYQILFRLWQNALLNQPLSPVELYKIARKNWGDPHTFSTEDDTWGCPQSLNPSHGKSEMLEDEKEDFLLVEGEAEGNSREGLSGEGNVVNREDPSSDSSPLRLRAHSLPEGHAKTGRQVAVSSQGSGLQPHSPTTVSKVITTMTTSNANSNGVWEGTGGTRERIVSTISPYCGDHGRSSGATCAAFAGVGRDMGSVVGASRHSPQQPPDPSGNSVAIGDTDSCLSHPVLIIRDGTDYHSVSESVMSSEFETTSFLDQGEVLCGCEIHEGCTVINDVYDADIETIFQVLFTDSEFMKKFLHSRGTTNIDFGEWFAHVDGSRVRDMKYTIALNYSFGPKFSPSTERQVYSKVSQPGLKHIVESEVCNGNVPYNDKFYTCVRVCMTRVTHSQTRIRVTSNIAFRKNCWGVVKNLIERNVGDGLRSHYAHLDMSLKEHVTSLALKKKVPHKGSSRRARKQRRQLSSVPWESNGASVPPSRGHHSRKPSLSSTGGYPVAENITDPALLTRLSTHSSHADLLSSHQGGEGTASPPLLTNRFTVWLLLFVAFLVVCNMGLYYWLMRYQPGPPSPPTRATGGETPVLDKWPTSPEDWMSFVQDIQHSHRQQLKGYELLVTKLLDALKQMETDLARYHGTASQLLLDVRKEVPLPPADQAVPSQENQRDKPTETPLRQEL